jgi:hypothetical protein
MSQTTAVRAALSVLVLDPKIRAFLARHDPKALKQAEAALGVVPWQDVPLYWLDTGRDLDDEERVKALSEYRRTGEMSLVVMVEPDPDDDSADAEECERVSAAGPSVERIDRDGFPG